MEKYSTKNGEVSGQGVASLVDAVSFVIVHVG
ncbi:MAG: hypothetical protein UY98_C0034G0018, partial [Candidatus Kaiserbacteria bacterium GW2011_GWA2_58_9]